MRKILIAVSAALFTMIAGLSAGYADDSQTAFYQVLRQQHEALAQNVDTLTTGSIQADGAVAKSAHREARKGRALGYDASARGRYRDLIAKHAKANGIPFALADAVVRIESRYNPHARNGGAVGLMQIKPRTAQGLGYRGGAAGLLNPETNIKFGVKYLAQAYRLAGGDICGTVMRYQSGHYARHMSRANKIYCSKVRTIQASL